MKKGICKHFRGTINKRCGRGVVIRELVGGPDRGWVTRLPCHQANTTAIGCEQYAEPTDDEVAEYDAEVAKDAARMKVLAPAISRIKEENQGKNTKGTMECPICGGDLHWTHAAYNGHVWGRCETKDCVSWME